MAFRTPLVAAGLAALLAVGTTGCQAPGAAPSPTVVRTTAETGTPAASASPSADAAQGSELRSLSVPAAGFDQAVIPRTTVEMGNAINPPTYSPGKPSLPVRVSDRGVLPAAGASDTVYVGCHTSARYGAEKYPCNTLVRAVKAGDDIVATTDAGTLTYTVTHTRSIPYGDFAGDEETWRVEPDRLVFVMCDIVDGRGNHANWVIYADLTASQG